VIGTAYLILSYLAYPKAESAPRVDSAEPSHSYPPTTHACIKIHSAGKLVPRSRLAYFVGMDNESTGFRIYFSERRIINVERKVAFDRSKGDDSITINIEATPAPSEINDKIRENSLEPEIVPLEDDLNHSHWNTCSTATGISLCYEIQCYGIRNHLEYCTSMLWNPEYMEYFLMFHILFHLQAQSS
jgi:hypothetical protein